jgi:putative tryptophan/tyrosine transport system substrate-binding protein
VRRPEKNVTKKILIWLLATIFLTTAHPAEAQQPGRFYRIGYLSNGDGNRQQEQALQKALRARGYTDGQNIVIERRYTKGKSELLPDLAAELVRLKVDCLVTSGIEATRAAKQATAAIPIVMSNASDDAVRHGLIASLARPGGNITGVIEIVSDLAGKRLALLKEAFPNISKISHLSDRGSPTGAAHLKETEAVTRAMRLRFQPLEVQGPSDFENAFRAASKKHADGLVVATYGFIDSHRERVVDLANRTRLPVMYTNADFVRDGGFMSYADNPLDRAERAAVFVEKILNGAKPGELRVEQPTNFEFVINLKTAKMLNLTMPQSVVFRADKVIR